MTDNLTNLTSMKICSCCRIEKPDSDFRRKTEKRPERIKIGYFVYLSSLCRKCEREKALEHHKKKMSKTELTEKVAPVDRRVIKARRAALLSQGKRPSGYSPPAELKFYKRAFRHGRCVKECDESCKAIGLCACDSIENAKQSDPHSAYIDRDWEVDSDKRTKLEQIKEERKARRRQLYAIKIAKQIEEEKRKKPLIKRFSYAGWTPEAKKERELMLKRAEGKRRRQAKKNKTK